MVQLIGIQSVVQCGICPGITFGLLTILWRFWKSIFPCWLDVMYQPRSSVYVTRISLGLMIYADVLSTSSRRLIFGGPVSVLGLIGKSVHCQVRANETYSDTKHQFIVRNIDVLMNIQSPHKCWSTLKSAVFGSSSSLPPLEVVTTTSPGGRSTGSLLICWSLAICLLV